MKVNKLKNFDAHYANQVKNEQLFVERFLETAKEQGIVISDCVIRALNDEVTNGETEFVIDNRAKKVLQATDYLVLSKAVQKLSGFNVCKKIEFEEETGLALEEPEFESLNAKELYQIGMKRSQFEKEQSKITGHLTATVALEDLKGY